MNGCSPTHPRRAWIHPLSFSMSWVLEYYLLKKTYSNYCIENRNHSPKYCCPPNPALWLSIEFSTTRHISSFCKSFLPRRIEVWWGQASLSPLFTAGFQVPGIGSGSHQPLSACWWMNTWMRKWRGQQAVNWFIFFCSIRNPQCKCSHTIKAGRTLWWGFTKDTVVSLQYLLHNGGQNTAIWHT